MNPRPFIVGALGLALIGIVAMLVLYDAPEAITYTILGAVLARLDGILSYFKGPSPP